MFSKYVEDLLAYRKKRDELFAWPELMDYLCGYVADGGSLLDLARTWGVKYSCVTNWIRKDKARNDLYEAAKKDRSEHVIESTLHILKTVSQFDIRTLYDDSGNLKPIKDWPHEASLVVSSIKPTEYGNELKMSERLKAVELVGKNKALFTDRTVLEAGKSLTDLLEESWGRGEKETKD